jgi:hypothetical protein
LATVWQPSAEAKARVVVTAAEEFIKQATDGPCSKPIFEETMDNSEIRVQNGLAQVWAHYVARFGVPGKVDKWEGIDAFTLLQHEGAWRIVSVAYKAER